MVDVGLFWLKLKVLDVWQKGDFWGFVVYVDGIELKLEEIIVVKKYVSVFFGILLVIDFQVFFFSCGIDFYIKYLQVFNIDILVICGVSIFGCVRVMILDVMQYGFWFMVRNFY